MPTELDRPREQRIPTGPVTYSSVGEAVGAMLGGDWRVFFRSFAMTSLVVLWTVAAGGLFLWVAGRNGLRATHLEISNSPRVVLQQATKDGSEYRVLVSPAANPTPWQDSGIRIKPGDHVEIEAEGRVNINLYGLVQHVQKRHEIEARIGLDLRQHRLALRPDTSRLPERYYTEDDRRALNVKRGWSGPDGYEGLDGITDAAYPARTANKLVPQAPFGVLLGAVHEGTRDPQRQEAFLIGAHSSKDLAADGTLWFAVNDVWDAQDQRFPDKFYVDNLGFFLVRVLVSH
jgi:hypothetical protein